MSFRSFRASPGHNKPLASPLDRIVTNVSRFRFFRSSERIKRPEPAVNRLTLCPARAPHPVDPMPPGGYQESVISGVIAPDRQVPQVSDEDRDAPIPQCRWVTTGSGRSRRKSRDWRRTRRARSLRGFGRLTASGSYGATGPAVQRLALTTPRSWNGRAVPLIRTAGR